jgi:hypothetical protein
MIRLQTDNGDFDLSPNTSIPWQVQNPFFEENEDFAPQLSLPFKLPLTPNNQILLSYAEQLQVSVYAKSIVTSLYIGGVFFFKGSLNILRPGSTGYEVSLSYNKKDIDTSKSIRDFEYGGSRNAVADSAARTAANLLNYPYTDYVWPQWYNTANEKNKLFNGSAILLNDFHGFAALYNNKELVTPTPFLPYIMKQLFKELGGIDAVGSFFKEVTDKVIYNPVVANTMDASTEGLNIYTSSEGLEFDLQYKEMKVGINDANTYYNISTGAVLKFDFYSYPVNADGPATLRALTYNVTGPDVASSQTLLQNLWTAIQAIAPGFILRYQNWADPVNPYFTFANASRYTSRSRDFLGKWQINYSPFGNYSYNDVLLNKHLPDITVKDFINAIKNAFNLTIFYNMSSQVITFTPRKNQLNTGKYKDYTDKLIEQWDKEVLETSNYRFVFANDKKDVKTEDETKWYATNHQEHNAKGYKEFVSDLAAPFVELYAPPVFGTTNDYMPTVEQQLYKYADADVPDFTLRLMTWKGVVIDLSGLPFPKVDDTGLTPNEMYNDWFKDWYRATKLGRELADMQMMLTLEDLRNFDPELKWKVLHNMYVWKSIETPITMQGLGASRVRLMRIPANQNTYNTANGEALPPE